MKKRESKWRFDARHWLVTIGLSALACFGVDQLIANNLFVNNFDAYTIDALTGLTQPIPARKDIVIVQLDEDSARKLVKGNPEGNPDRRVFGELFEGLAQAKASVVLCDLLLVADLPVEDKGLVQSLVRASESSETQFILTLDRKEIEPAKEEGELPSYDFLISPTLAKAIPNVRRGFSMGFTPNSNVSGCLTELQDFDSEMIYWHTALLTAWTHSRVRDEEAKYENDKLILPGWEFDLGGNGEILMSWTEQKEGFSTISLSQALGDLKAGKGDRFAGKIVMFVDSRPSTDVASVAKHGLVPGYLVVANLINTALQPTTNRLHWPSFREEAMRCFLIALVPGLAIKSGKRPWIIFGILSPVLLGIVVPIVVAMNSRLLLFALWPFLSSTLVALASLAILAWHAGPRDSRSEGQLMEATVLFSDLEDSTGLVGILGASEYQRVFGDWVKNCAVIVQQHGGVLERTTGDGFIAVFPNQNGIGVESCYQAALAMRNLLESQPPVEGRRIKASFGFESGPVSGGYVTEAGRKVWSSSGTTVNKARRLQSLAGSEGVWMVFGPFAASFLSEKHKVERRGHRDLKGISHPVETFSIGIPDENQS